MRFEKGRAQYIGDARRAFETCSRECDLQAAHGVAREICERSRSELTSVRVARL